MSDVTAEEQLENAGYYGLLPDKYIKQLCHCDEPMIRPFVPEQVRAERSLPVISYGSTSCGYDIRVASEFKIYSNINNQVNDPKRISEDNFITVNRLSEVIIPPNSYALCRSLEEFDMPRDVLGLAVGKSTYARCGILVNVTPLEPGWKGYLTVEIANLTTLPARVYPEEGIAQILFFKTLPCSVSYKDRGGKYQDQPARVVLPRM